MESVSIALHHIAGKTFHRLSSDGPSLSSSQRGLCGIEAREEFGAAALALHPKGQRLLHRLCRVAYAV
jgi:hypothetical protein